MPLAAPSPTMAPGAYAGVLHEQWGERMREPRLRESFCRTGTDDLRRRTGIPEASGSAVRAAADPPTLALLRQEAEAERGRPWAALTASLSARFARDGDRAHYEAAVAAREQRLTRAVVLAAATASTDWLDEAADGAVLLCEQSSWALPAHDDAGARRGFVLPDAGRPALDLGAGEVVAQLAVADRLLGTHWDDRWPGLRERIRHEAELRVFTPFETRDDFWWLGYERTVNNWNPWILGNLLLAAALLLDDPARLARLTARALESLDRYVATLPSDGAIDEGVAYWWNGAARMLELLDLVDRLTAGELDPAGLPFVPELLRFPQRMQLGGEWSVNMADGWARSPGGEPWQLAFRWGRRTGDADVVDWARGGRRPQHAVAPVAGGLPRLVRALLDPEWRDTVPTAPPLPRTVWLPSTQVFVSRARAGDASGLTLAAKGGTNGESHNHNDLGSFIVAADGRPLLVDVGKPTYSRQTFGPERYGIRAMQSGWHNAPAPHGLEQGEGSLFATRVTSAPAPTAGETAEPAATLELDLTDAYPLAAGEEWRRSFRLASAERAEITDSWRLRPTASAPAGWLTLVAAGEVERAADRVLVSAEGRSIAIRVEGVVPESEEWVLDDAELAAVWGARLTRLRYPLPAAVGSLTTVVELLR